MYGWNLAIALVTGNTTLWKPSPTTPLVSVAVTRLIAPVLEKNGLPGAVASLVCGDVEVGKELVGSEQVQMGMLIPPTKLIHQSALPVLKPWARLSERRYRTALARLY